MLKVVCGWNVYNVEKSSTSYFQRTLIFNRYYKRNNDVRKYKLLSNFPLKCAKIGAARTICHEQSHFGFRTLNKTWNDSILIYYRYCKNVYHFLMNTYKSCSLFMPLTLWFLFYVFMWTKTRKLLSQQVPIVVVTMSRPKFLETITISSLSLVILLLGLHMDANCGFTEEMIG